MRQIPLSISDEPVHSFDNFVSGGNAQAVKHLRKLGSYSAGLNSLDSTSPPVYLWGESGSGKTHLLQALADRVREGGGRCSWFGATMPTPWPFDERDSLIVFDDCERFDEAQQHAAFALFVEATTHGVAVAAAGLTPPVDLPLRDDLRTRLGWGHVFALVPLSEAEVRAALRREGDRRGLFLSDDVMGHLLTRFDRDLKSLMAMLERLDEFALAHKRAITVPLLKQMISEEGLP